MANEVALERENIQSVEGVIGEVKMFAGNVIPDNWLICDGATYKTKDKTGLFEAVGYKFGGSDGLFKVPEIEALKGVQYIICSR